MSGAASPPDHDQFVWDRPCQRRRDAAAVLLPIAVVVAGLVAGFAFAIAHYGSPWSQLHPRKFDHAAWVRIPEWRKDMLSDLLTDKVCRGTTYSSVVALLGNPDWQMSSLDRGSYWRVVNYEVGTADPLQLNFTRTKAG